MTQELELRELLLDELQTVLDVRLLFSRKWLSVQAYVDLDSDSQGEVLIIKWHEPKYKDEGSFNKIEYPINALPIVVEEQKEKLREDIPDTDTGRILAEAVKEYFDDDTDTEVN